MLTAAGYRCFIQDSTDRITTERSIPSQFAPNFLYQAVSAHATRPAAYTSSAKALTYLFKPSLREDNCLLVVALRLLGLLLLCRRLTSSSPGTSITRHHPDIADHCRWLWQTSNPLQLLQPHALLPPCSRGHRANTAGRRPHESLKHLGATAHNYRLRHEPMRGRKQRQRTHPR